MNPSARIEYSLKRKIKARLRVEDHPLLPGATVLSFTDADGADIEITITSEDAALLRRRLEERDDTLPCGCSEGMCYCESKSGVAS